ncbi:hypothetical protein [Aliarcobacter butzleri]|uniref:hypothetical protein n=1 Tax=Aliarcobacter butzleri TaxID=28197 RepID=UPI00263C0EED|nr:hypothetical protein [Aliarcobacter butzleri]MDN5082979.1 hypothetical protein [Aliarcobacter butzleri]MDN5085059.1 hypothetical protein [Aliarcobacter butzleri]
MKNIFEYFEKSLDLIYRLIFYISLISIICVVSFIIGIIYNNYGIKNDIVIGMLPALGITLSALLASTSLMKSIQNTNRIEKIKKQNELELKKNKISFYFRMVQSYIRMYIIDFKMIIDDDLLSDFKIKLEEYLKLILNDNDIKVLDDYEIQSYIIFMELNINYTTRYLDKKDYPQSKKELMEVIENSYNEMYLALESLSKKYNLNFLDFKI